jgi:mRNA interferase HicA
VKKRDLERRLRELGWQFLRHGANHDVWTSGEQSESVPRHNEIDERLARKILRNAEKNPPRGGIH